MGSDKRKRGDDRNRGGSSDPRRQRTAPPSLEGLEDRRLLAQVGWTATSTDPFDVQHGPLAPLGQTLINVYKDFAANGAKPGYTPALSKLVQFRGNLVGVDVSGVNGVDLPTMGATLKTLGMQITSAWAGSSNLVEGFIPIASLPKLAVNAQIKSASPMLVPVIRATANGYPFQGVANNQSANTLNVPTAVSATASNGTGQMIGVLSDTVSRVAGGLADSIKTGDLPSNVQVLQDNLTDPNPTDEGRAMLEQIHDIAPGAQLGFATATTGEASFGNNIIALAKAGYSTIVDDIGYGDEPAFQDGVISQGVNTATALGATYLSAAGNAADDGYLSTFRGVNTSVGSLGAGRYMNFNPNGGTQATLGLFVPNNNNPPQIWFQFDQPYGNATSDITAYLLDASGNIAYQGISNGSASGATVQVLLNPAGTSAEIAPGTYSLVIKVNSGADPGHVYSYNPTDGDAAFDKSFGSAGGTYYPTTLGHSAAANTIGVGAVPYYGAAPYVSSTTNNNEPFSSFGPVLSLFNPDGSAKTPQLLQKPDISGADGNNTSFFASGPLSTTQPVFPVNVTYPGNQPTTVADPITTVNYNQNLKVFYGTSSAAPNVAAVVALMKQVNSGVTRAQIVSALATTATPLNGQAAGTWNPQAGFGLVNATRAIGQVSVLQVNSISPGASATITAAPTAITVSFSKAIVLSSIQAATLQVAGANGSTVIVGAPVGVDNPTNPTVVSFPITIIPALGRVANGGYLVKVNAGTVRALDGTTLAADFFDAFNLQSIAPKVASTAISSRIIAVTFSEAVAPGTVNANNVVVFRAGGVNNPLLNPADVLVSQLPGAVVTYNPATLTATIDLTNVAQGLLPTDRYGIAVTTNVTDLVGNPLNGAFNGVFPSGVANPNGLGSNFYQDLGVQVVQPPTVSALVLNPNSDTGVPGDLDTANPRPSFIGQVGAVFPSTNAGLLVYVQFNGINHTGLAQGGLNIAPGAGGRNVVGQYDAVAKTDANGRFVVDYPVGVAPLPEGQNIVRVVVVGATDALGAGPATTFNQTFQVDDTRPYIGTLNGTSPTSVPEGASVNNLSTLSINIIDPVNPQSRTSPFAVSPQTPALAVNGATITNLSNFSLYQVFGPGQLLDVSSYIVGSTFVSTSARVLPTDPYTGQIVLSFAPGLPQGNYTLVVRSNTGGYAGVTDQAGNALASSAADSASGKAGQFAVNFRLQPTPTYITGYTAYSDNGAGNIFGVQSQPRASYEVPAAGVTPGAPAPPVAFTIDFSNQLAARDYTNDVILARSANSAAANPDGDFGNFGTLAGLTDPTGYVAVPNIHVALMNSVAGATYGQFGYQNRLMVYLDPNTTLTPDYYRFYLPNISQAVSNPTLGNRTFQPISDAFGNQLDGEFLGYQNAQGKYVNQLNDGTTRGSGAFDTPDLSGDGVAGGAFVTGFVVVPNGNVIYARPDAVYNPQLQAAYPDGTQANPYPVLAPEAVPTAVNGGDLNSPVNSGINFNGYYDRSGLGTFQPSAFFAAQEKARQTLAPVVIVAQPALLTRDPLTGIVSQRPFVLQSPITVDQTNTNDASAAVPAMTTLIFAQGSTLKMQNASLLVQNQGSALQIQGGPNPSQIVTVTSYRDSSVGGATNGDPSSIPASGDYGGILFRNFNQAAGAGGAGRISLFPGQIPITGSNVSDGRLKGPFTNTTSRTSQLDAISGADPVMSFVNFLVEKYAGGVVPNVTGFGYDGITLQNSRPTIVNSSITLSGGTGSAQAGISADFDSLLQDDVAAGPLIRNDTFANNGLNGILVRGLVGSGTAQATDATDLATGGAGAAAVRRNYVINNPYPYLLTSRLVLGQEQLVETGGSQAGIADRLYVAPGMIVKVIRGGGIDVSGAGSINTGDRTYLNEFDAGTDNPTLPGFKANSALLANALFTSLNDDVATTTYTDPQSGAVRTVVAALPALPNGAGASQPTTANVPDVSRWGGIAIASGSIAVLNSTIFRYGGGSINTSGGTGTRHLLEVGGSNNDGAHISVTNNTFVANADTAINLSAQALLAGDATRPLVSGNPFIHGNVFQSNAINGVGVTGGTPPGPLFPSNLNHSSIWTGSDFTYVLRDTIVLGPVSGLGLLPTPSATGFVTEPTPSVVLTLQSTLPGTLLADGTVVAGPGVPLIIKELNNNPPPTAPTDGTDIAPGNGPDYQGGAGFIAGVDDGVDPPAVNFLYDNGVASQIRILGIGGNASTGQARVPVIITSLYDNTVGTTVNGVVMNQALPTGSRAARAGDGGVIYFGANSLSSYSITDLRSGSVIDNADIKYITRIEQQDGGPLYARDLNGDNSVNGLDVFDEVKAGVAGFETQYNTSHNLMISDSNLSTFSDGGIYSHTGFNAIEAIPGVVTNPRLGIKGEPNKLFVVNTTISNMTQGRAAGIQAVSQKGDDFVPDGGQATSATVVVVLNSTFYKNTKAVEIYGAAPNGVNGLSHVSLLAMDSIFSTNGYDTAGTTAVDGGGALIGHNQTYGSDSQYNLFFNNTLDVTNNGNLNGGINNSNPYTGDPAFRSPDQGDFNLKSTSAAIDRSRDQLGPTYFGDFLYPVFANSNLNLNAAPIRNNTANTYFDGGYFINYADFLTNPGVVTLPGLPVTQRQFPDQWVASLTTAPSTAIIPATSVVNTTPGTPGTSYVPNGTYAYTPIYGQRDILGNRRLKVLNSPNPPGFGTDLGFDLGAYEYQNQFPPVVTAVVAATVDGTFSNLYVPGGVGGTNKYPNSLLVGINERLNPATITGNSVFLVGSGGDGIFGNANDIRYNLTNRVSFDNNMNAVVINTAGLLPNGAALNDQYRLTLKGTGTSIIRDNRGVALDGATNNGAAALPSGVDAFPGSDFNVEFTIDTNPPTLVAGSFGLAPGSFGTAAATAGAAAVSFPITGRSTPTFVGRITDIFPPAAPAAGDAVFVDISTTGDPNNFNVLNAASGFTDASGNFSVTVASPLPGANFNVGPDGKQGTADDTGFSLARVRVVDQAGNTTLLPTSSFSDFVTGGAALKFEVDTTPPQVVALTPSSGTLTSSGANGNVTVTATISKNIDPATLNTNSVQVFRAGGSGTFTGAGTPVTIVPGSFAINYLGGAKGQVQVTFQLQGPLPNDFYRIVLKGTGANPIRDLAGNALDGLGTGVPGSGDYTNGTFTVFAPGNARLLYVGAPATYVTSTTAVQGTRNNPYPTIAAGIAAAQTGDYVVVLPGTYRETVQLKSQVRLVSGAITSTDTAFSPGNPLNTIIFGNTSANQSFNTTAGVTVVQANNLNSVAGLPTEISGFTILTPLLGDSVRGTLDTSSVGIALTNSDVTVDRNYIVNAGIGVAVGTTGANVSAPQIFDNVIAGNYFGILTTDNASTTSYARPTQVLNNTIAYNTYGLYSISSRPNVTSSIVVNDIFYNNHDLTTARNGTGIFSSAANSVYVGYDLFYANGVSGAPSSNATGTFNVNVAALTSYPDQFGNLVADPAFVNPQDPRPDGNTAPTFFNYANFDLTSRSAAINGALGYAAPATDILYRSPVAIAGKGVFGTGPASIGAFYYKGTGGATTVVVVGKPPVSPTNPTVPTGGAATNAGSTVSAMSLGTNTTGTRPIGTRAFTVVNSSLDPDGTGTPGVAQAILAPTTIDLNFSDNVDRSSLTADDLVLSGSGLDAANPAHATGLTWVDDHTVRFLLAGGFKPNGSVNVSIARGAIKDTDGTALDAFAEAFQLGSTAAVAGSVAAPATVALPVVQPLAVAGPVAVHYGHGKHATKSHAAKMQAAATALAHKKEAAAAKAKAHAQAKAKAHEKAQAHKAAAKHAR